ncbi:MAG: hypothetical protein O2827_06750, partial [Verrucomicrobia bacterium]|nr:hypothetical protein [Verrucomicrobiota bacterium]
MDEETAFTTVLDTNDVLLNIDVLFNDRTLSDYSLQSDSRAVGFGLLSAASNYDINNNLRPNPQGSYPDLGAFESEYGTVLTLGLTAQQVDGQAELDWLDFMGAYDYQIIRKNQSGVVLLDTVTNSASQTTFRDRSISASGTYTYIVSARNSNGEVIFTSEEVEISITVNPNHFIPYNLVSEVTLDTVRLTWNLEYDGSIGTLNLYKSINEGDFTLYKDGLSMNAVSIIDSSRIVGYDYSYKLSVTINGVEYEASNSTTANIESAISTQIVNENVIVNSPSIGDGTETSPYEIETLNHLLWLSQYVIYFRESHFILVNDIDLSASENWENESGFGFPSIRSFFGEFDGQNYEINNLYMVYNNAQFNNMYGFFGIVSGNAVIKNLSFNNSYVEESNSNRGNAFQWIGTLAGQVGEGTLVENVHVDNGVVIGHTGVGCLSGATHNATIRYSSTQCLTKGTTYVGGLIGWIRGQGGDFYQNYTLGQVMPRTTSTQATQMGGLVGRNEIGRISDSFSLAEVSGYDIVAGLIGTQTSSSAQAWRNYAANEITQTNNQLPYGLSQGGYHWSSIFDEEYSTTAISVNSRSRVEMFDIETYKELNQNSKIWSISEEDSSTTSTFIMTGGYPILRNNKDIYLIEDLSVANLIKDLNIQVVSKIRIDSAHLNYRFQISKTPSFEVIEIDTMARIAIIDQSYEMDVSSLERGEYYLRVKMDDGKMYSRWKTTTVDIYNLEVESLDLAEETLTNVISHEPIVLFSGGGNVRNNYHYQLANELGFTEGILFDSGVLEITSNDSIKIQSDLIDGENYLFRLKIGIDDFISPWDTLAFRMNSLPSEPILLPLTDRLVTK